jgi:hypothetical protein
MKAGGRRPGIACFHMNICGVCNEWTTVTQPRDYGYPAVSSKHDHPKILSNMQKVKDLYIAEGKPFAVQVMDDLISKYIHSM